MTSSYLYLNALRIHYLQWSAPDSDAPILLLHGLASNAHIWDLVAPCLVASGLAPLAPDSRGHGLTDKPDGDYGFDTFTNDLAAFVDACHLERPLIVGHSWGASLALEYAARFAIGPRAPRGIILVDGGIGQLDEPGVTWEQVRDRLTPPRLAGMPLESFISRMQANNPLWLDDQIQAITLANFEITEDPATGIEVIAPRLTFERHMKIVAALWDFKTYQRASMIRCPILAIPARNQRTTSETESQFSAYKERGIARMQQIKPDIQVHWMDDTIHDIPLHRPEELADIIVDFARKYPSDGKSVT
jgi:pimeloyl-ACP methyl ester carboxylesterase